MTRRTLTVIAGFLFWPPLVAAQSATTGAIAGIVRDATGAVLPGVTVEAASPALIEKTRSVVTDGDGQYKIIELRPGGYTVTFTLPGFNVVRREGIELTTGFTATVNGDMHVGSLEETITVSGAAPIVDTQNVRTQNVLSREALDVLPTNRTVQGFATLTVGATTTTGGGGGSHHDVGGNKAEQYQLDAGRALRQSGPKLSCDTEDTKDLRTKNQGLQGFRMRLLLCRS
jgi:hypothetical protein